jgi:hypothetical protein
MIYIRNLIWNLSNYSTTFTFTSHCHQSLLHLKRVRRASTSFIMAPPLLPANDHTAQAPVANLAAPSTGAPSPAPSASALSLAAISLDPRQSQRPSPRTSRQAPSAPSASFLPRGLGKRVRPGSASQPSSAPDPHPHPRSPWKVFVMLVSSLNPARSPWNGPPPSPRIRVHAPRSVSMEGSSTHGPRPHRPDSLYGREVSNQSRIAVVLFVAVAAEEKKERAPRKDVHVHHRRPMLPKESPRKFHDTLC